MDLPTIHGPFDYPWTFRLSMDLPTVHGPSDCPWSSTHSPTRAPIVLFKRILGNTLERILRKIPDKNSQKNS
ncbi:CLUMA_CG017074, isoform A [Clunio marinus]|uniref:CLUMA_CG017074, isoform A n=1 Tax=Clunio marinus TaxID=568069 RepID=A0A1J1IW78_9DIPT|nr:CLUMA_CG017074, isoform A [Clunio marinus]